MNKYLEQAKNLIIENKEILIPLATNFAVAFAGAYTAIALFMNIHGMVPQAPRNIMMPPPPPPMMDQREMERMQREHEKQMEQIRKEQERQMRMQPAPPIMPPTPPMR